jgi:hypothetical protein
MAIVVTVRRIIVQIGRFGRMMIKIRIWSESFGGARFGFGRPRVEFGQIEGGVQEKDSDGKGSEGIDVDVLGGDAMSERIFNFLILYIFCNYYFPTSTTI